MDLSMGSSSGFAFVNQGGFRTTGASSYGPGVLQNWLQSRGEGAIGYRSNPAIANNGK
jgi:hypothetical protein